MSVEHRARVSARRAASAALWLAIVASNPAPLGAQSRRTPTVRLAFAHPDGPVAPRDTGAPASGARAKKSRPAPDAAPRMLAPTISLASVHLREVLAWDEGDGRATDGAPRRIDWILRDRTNWQHAAMDDRTLAAVRDTCVHFGCERIEVVSGYRSSKMNEMLRKKGRHVAQRSQHPLATAVDFRLVGVEMAPVFRWLERSHNGGVGRYRDDAFVHVDSGPRRRWRGE